MRVLYVFNILRIMNLILSHFVLNIRQLALFPRGRLDWQEFLYERGGRGEDLVCRGEFVVGVVRLHHQGETVAGPLSRHQLGDRQGVVVH